MKINGTDVMNNDSISATPQFNISILTASPIVISSVKMLLDGINVAGISPTKESEILYTIDHKITSALSDGPHQISIEATDVDGDTSTWEITGLSVKNTVASEVERTPLNFPNPFDPASGTTISYYLTKDSNIQINIYDLTGTLIAKKSYSASSQGGNAGYNEVAWNATSDSGELIGNGMYIYMIIADGRVASKGKMVAFRK